MITKEMISTLDETKKEVFIERIKIQRELFEDILSRFQVETELGKLMKNAVESSVETFNLELIRLEGLLREK